MYEKGILYVVFGEKFYNLAIKTIKYSRKFTDLPFHVLTNVKENEFETIENTSFLYFDRPTAENRVIKTNMINYTPFQTTIYMDCDAAIQKTGIEIVFDLIKDHDLLLAVYGTWTNSTKALSYYRITMHNLGVYFPLVLYYGAFIAFNKTRKAYEFFENWYENWKKSTVAREMPALACTMKKMQGLKLQPIMIKDNIFSWKINYDAIVQHEYGNGPRFWNYFFERNADK